MRLFVRCVGLAVPRVGLGMRSAGLVVLSAGLVVRRPGLGVQRRPGLGARRAGFGVRRPGLGVRNLGLGVRGTRLGVRGAGLRVCGAQVRQGRGVRPGLHGDTRLRHFGSARPSNLGPAGRRRIIRPCLPSSRGRLRPAERSGLASRTGCRITRMSLSSGERTRPGGLVLAVLLTALVRLAPTGCSGAGPALVLGHEPRLAPALMNSLWKTLRLS
ncbi:hypothetical protein GCM10027360_26920 [Amycolatopsis echigonensis]